MKIIFLDVDGVLINSNAIKLGFGKVDRQCVLLLNKLTDVTGAAIVFSSCWRIGRTIEECRELLSNWGVTGSVLDRTINDWGATRGKEIQLWLNAHKEVEIFVIIDDGSDMGLLILNLVQTDFEFGFTDDDYDKALKILEGGK